MNGDENNNRTYFYIALSALVGAAAALGCAFIPAIGVYMLITSVLLELGALAFLSAQKKKNDFRGLKYLTVAAYILLALSAALFCGGLIYVAVTR